MRLQLSRRARVIRKITEVHSQSLSVIESLRFCGLFLTWPVANLPSYHDAKGGTQILATTGLFTAKLWPCRLKGHVMMRWLEASFVAAERSFSGIGICSKFPLRSREEGRTYCSVECATRGFGPEPPALFGELRTGVRAPLAPCKAARRTGLRELLLWGLEICSSEVLVWAKTLRPSAPTAFGC